MNSLIHASFIVPQSYVKAVLSSSILVPMMSVDILFYPLSPVFLVFLLYLYFEIHMYYLLTYYMKITLCRYILLLLFVIGNSSFLYADDHINYYFKQLSIEQGLSQGTVNSMQLDNKGVMWIGTNAGLNTFDKNKFNVYMHDEHRVHSLPGNAINFIFEDLQNTIWVSTNNGLVQYDPVIDGFRPILPKGKGTAYGYMPFDDGILFSVAGSFFVYYYASRELTEHRIKNISNAEALFFEHVHPLDKTKVLLTSREFGIWVYEPFSHRLSRHPIQMQNIVASCTDQKGNFYISSYKDGIRGFSKEGKQLFHLHTHNSDLSSNIILNMLFHHNKLWVGTDGGGINIIDPEHPKQINSLQHKPGVRGTLPNNSIKILYADKKKNLWAGTVRDGMFGIREVPIHTYKDAHLMSGEGLSEKIVNSLHEDHSGVLWIGTDGGGINSYSPKTGSFVHYPQTFGEKIVSISSYSPNELLVSNYEKGLLIFDKKSAGFRPFNIVNKEINDRECFSGYAVFIDKASECEVFLLSVNTYLFNIASKSFRQMTTQEDQSHLRALRLIHSDGNRFYFKGNNRIFQANRSDLVLKTIFKGNENEYINSACFDGERRFWIGTDYGLSYYDILTQKHVKIDTKLFSGISMLFLDEQKRLWISAQNLLFSYSIATNRFAIWGETDGFTANELLSPPVSSNHAPVYYMGGVSGLIKINKDISIDGYLEPSIKLTNVVIDGEVTQTKSERILLPYNYKSLAIKVTSDETDIFRKVLFRYTLSGINQPPIETYSYNLTLPQLLPGTYSLEVACSTKSGNWTVPTRLLTVVVTPPWYQRPWVIVVFSFIFFASIIGVTRLLLIRKESKLKWAMKEHEQQVYEEKIKFLINISHELRTPLTLIYAPLKRLLDSFIPRADSQEDMERYGTLTRIYKQTKEMKNIINMVLDLNKLGDAKKRLMKQPYLLNNWVKEVSEDFRTEFEYHHIQLEYRFDDRVGTVVFDKNKCEIVLSNLLMNALKFSVRDTVVTVSTKICDTYVRISVSDQGIGLNQIDPSKCFERFFQGEHSEKGSGIGLSYAKALIDLHQGHIGASNNLTQGATFYYELPFEENVLLEHTIDTVEADTYTAKQYADHENSFSTKAYTIIVIEDKAELLEFLREELKGLFSKVYTASNGEKALRIIKEKSPDIIVSDVMMPLMDGFELCKRVKEELEISHIPIILLTARTDENSTSLGYKLGADAYLPKPFELNTLLDVICNLLKMKERIKSFLSKGTTDHLLIDALTTNNADEAFIKKLNSIINTNIDNPQLDVAFLMQEMAISRTPLYNKIKALTGIGVNDYINNIRIAQAKELLAQTDKSITEISDLTGFSYQRYFSTIFKQATGVSPSQYRNNIRGEAT